MRRREFIAGLAGAAAWPLASLAQQPDRVRRVGALITLAEGDPEARAWTSSLTRRLGELGWAAGRNIHIDVRWDAGDAKQAQMHAAEMVALAPEVILADGTRAVAALQRASPTIPVVFVQVPDPVGAGVLPSLSRPGGNL
jgi:putative ABC transport system substrate-binding protein